MINEKSAGVICFRVHPQDGLQYLVLYHRGDYWNFPKGKMDPGETEIQTAQRELAEEAGITETKLAKNWRQETDFFFKEDRSGKKELIKKKLILFLSPVSAQVEPKISHEHNGYAWLDFKTAHKYVRFKNLRIILKEADSYIKSRIDLAQRSK